MHIAQPGDDDWRNADAIDRLHQRWECSSSSSTAELCDGGSYAPSIRVCTSIGVVVLWVTGPATLQLGVDIAFPINDVRVLRVTLWSDLTMDKHVSNVCSAFYRLRQLRRVRRSMDSESTATLIRAFVLRPALTTVTYRYCWWGIRMLRSTSYRVS